MCVSERQGFGSCAEQECRLAIDFAVMTVSRPQDYVRRLLEALAPSIRVQLIIGSPDVAYLGELETNRFIEVVAPSQQEWGQINDREIHHRASWNYWRCLTLGAKSRIRRGLLVFEDDVLPAHGWERHFHETADQIEAEYGDRWLLSLYASHRFSCEGSNAYYTNYPTHVFCCTQAMYFPDKIRAGFARFLKKYGVDSFHAPYDLLLRAYLIVEEVPVFVTTPSLVQHIGEVSTGLGPFHQSPDFRPSV